MLDVWRESRDVKAMGPLAQAHLSFCEEACKIISDAHMPVDRILRHPARPISSVIMKVTSREAQGLSMMNPSP